MHTRTVVRAGAILSAVAMAAVLAACSSSTTTGSSAAASAEAGTVDLAAAGCPSTIVVQTDWWPESEHGHLYQMLGDDATVEADKKAVVGTLYAGGKSTGVKLEIRAGGAAINFNNVATQMYTDDSITFGYVTTDDQIANSGKVPTKAFFAPLDQSPIMVMWDPATYPNVTGVKDIGAALKSTGGSWLYFSGSAYMDYLISQGYVDKANTDSSYSGAPDQFVAAEGKSVQQGFASAEPYIYQNEVSAWDKPVKYSLISSTGWDPYQSEMVAKTGDFDKLTPCLKAFTPVLQQAEVDYFADPSKANALIQKAIAGYNASWSYSPGVADYAVKTMLADKIVSNGDNSTIGDFNDARMADFFTKASKIYTDLGTNIAPGLKATDLYTNEFIDTSIGLK
ncbi:MAG: nitrate ABC transporter substrate-binding protein [Microbacterium sp.]|jgi:hypothetical protein|uniref:Nitrate ABC transporter substrate-binding protein n=1 Tax=Microbacterium ginsengisoli TaxID=400772 RepID=A0A0F0LT03_9MICO|nr:MULTISPECIES: nitrate ABC transporter substrate-binding protein [Microbacterium]MAL07430.1 nitrate ABC transporter substrate-binding protein [Microbacterium sp.]MCK9916929.1 ABC transporter substrate-binding protein [Microbacteriaceae bacterium K1510]KJL35415.1 hypothetical protein RR49_02641 [Microbacterium ginsengisoli]KQR91251.1 nitrate ABC transporter substrate-binding protein [Microbacterium sp. Leaf347]KQS01243.1 nitrate ABC transporter substrate-binding protein [Microbacterium sp. Le